MLINIKFTLAYVAGLTQIITPMVAEGFTKNTFLATDVPSKARFYQHLLAPCSAASTLDCARRCGLNPACHGYKFIQGRHTCYSRSFITGSSDDKSTRDGFTSYSKQDDGKPEFSRVDVQFKQHVLIYFFFTPGYSVLSQDGSLPGWQTLTSIIPARNLGVFTAFTGDSGPKSYSAKTLVNIYTLDMLIHGQPWFDVNNFCQILDKMVSVASKDDAHMAKGINHASEAKRPLEDYQGFYRNLAFGDVRVWVNESLYLKYGDMGEYVLRPTTKKNAFLMEAMPGTLWYTTHVDVLRRKPYLAYFDTTPYSDSHIEVVTIPHFDEENNPLFSKRVRQPPLYDELMDGCNSAVGSGVFSWCLLVLSFFVAVR